MTVVFRSREVPAAVVEARFWQNVDTTGGSDGCWPWQMALSDGYGSLRVAGKHVMAHRLAYELLVGPIPDGLQLDHLCRNRACVNPTHLEPVTIAENIRRGETGINQRAKTHCPAGHAYDERNTLHRADGARRCRECHRRREADRHAARRAA